MLSFLIFLTGSRALFDKKFVIVEKTAFLYHGSIMQVLFLWFSEL